MIYGKVGRLGQGKTMRGVREAVDLVALRSRRNPTVLAGNIGVTPPPGIEYRQLPIDGFSGALGDLMARCLASKTGLVVIVDEIDTVWDAHEWQTMRKSDRYRLKQSRKYGADLIWTAQFVDQVEKSIRNITEEVELVRAFPSPSVARRERGARPWFIYGQTFRPGAVREIVGAVDPDKRLGRRLHRYRRADEALYDTDEIVVPQDTEGLCARHLREEREALCPRCHPEPGLVGLGLASFVAAAAESVEPEDLAAAGNGHSRGGWR